MAGGCLCNCNTAPTLIFACSGAGDVGELADQAARKLARDGFGKMSCLTGIGGKVSGIMTAAATAVQLVVIDGCQSSCGKKCLEQAALTDFIHIQLEELGFKKEQCEVNAQNITKVSNECVSRLRDIFGTII